MSEGWQRETRLTGVINATRCFLRRILDGLEISFYVRTVRRSVSEGESKKRPWKL